MCPVGWCCGVVVGLEKYCGVVLLGAGCGERWARVLLWGVLWDGGGGRRWAECVLWGGAVGWWMWDEVGPSGK